jgi:hypothetical protein
VYDPFSLVTVQSLGQASVVARVLAAATFGTPRRRTRRRVREVLGVAYAVPAFSSSDGDFGRRRLADAPREDVDGIAPSDCGARMGPIRYLRFAQNTPCPPCALKRDPPDCDCNATCHRPWLLGARALRNCLPRIVRRSAFGNSATAIRLSARSPEPAVIIDAKFRLVRNRPEAHSAPTRLAVILNCQKA